MIKIELESKVWDMVLGALAGLPYNQSAGLIEEIKRQAQEQLAPPPEEPSEDSE